MKKNYSNDTSLFQLVYSMINLWLIHWLSTSSSTMITILQSVNIACYAVPCLSYG